MQINYYCYSPTQNDGVIGWHCRAANRTNLALRKVSLKIIDICSTIEETWRHDMYSPENTSLQVSLNQINRDWFRANIFRFMSTSFHWVNIEL